MNILEDFQPFLKNWCHENHLPVPQEGKLNDVWQRAWQHYMDTYLTEHYTEIKQQFLDLKVLTFGDLKRIQAEEQRAKLQEIKVSENETAWDRIQNMMGN